jgi:hypothetical protein
VAPIAIFAVGVMIVEQSLSWARDEMQASRAGAALFAQCEGKVSLCRLPIQASVRFAGR